MFLFNYLFSALKVLDKMLRAYIIECTNRIKKQSKDPFEWNKKNHHQNP